MNLLETEAISVSDDECYYFNEYGSVEKVCDLLNELYEENRQLKYKNEILSDELEQAKALINKKWSEYLKKKME